MLDYRIIIGLMLTTVYYSTVMGDIIAYDCSYNTAQYAKVDLTEVYPCKSHTKNVTTSTSSIQLLQQSDTLDVLAYSCLVILHRNIYHCGMHSHTSTVSNAFMAYPIIMKKDRCISAIKTGEICLFCGTRQEFIITNLQLGQSRYQPITLAGSVGSTGVCTGSSYMDEFGTWTDVVAQGFITITLGEHRGQIDSVKDIIHLPNSLKCKASKSSCIDSTYGEFYWDSLPASSCNLNQYAVLFEGIGNITHEVGIKQDDNTKIVTVIEQDISFSLRLTQPCLVCGMQAYRTEHPKLIIIIKGSFEFIVPKRPTKPQDLDLFTYVNSKFVFIERNTRLNMESLYAMVNAHRCELEKNSLNYKLAIAEINPSQFAYLHTEAPGYTATKLGEVIYITKCHPVMVRLASSDRCYNELPVIYRNNTYFMTPRTHIIQTHGTEVTCNNIYTPMFKIDSRWYQINKGATETLAPLKLDPSTNYDDKQWHYRSISHLATSGIYSQQELDSLRDHLLYGNERDAVQSVLVRSVTGQEPNMQNINPQNLFTEDHINKLASNIRDKIWGWFSVFGNVTAGIIGLISIVKIIKWIIDSIINGTMLYQIYGISYQLIGCCFDSLTACLVKQKLDEHLTELRNDIELTAIKSTNDLPIEILDQQLKIQNETNNPHSSSITDQPKSATSGPMKEYIPMYPKFSHYNDKYP